MATQKLSQITPASSPPSVADQFVGVRAGTQDILFSQSQMEQVFATGGASNPEVAIAVIPNVTPGQNYGIGMCIGGLLHFANVLPRNSGILSFVRITVNVREDNTFTIYLFAANPTASVFNDNASAQIAAADANKVLMALPLIPLNQLGSHTIYATPRQAAVALAGTDLWAVIVPDGPLSTPFATASDVLVEITAIPN